MRGVKPLRHGSPRFSGRGILAVFGILGLLLTLGIMAFLAVQVLDGVSGDSSSGSSDLGTDDITVPTVAPGSPTDQAPATAPTGAADATACRTTLRTVETAAEAYNAINGDYPPDVATLVQEGLLASDQPIDAALRVEGGELVVTGTGRCAGQ